MAERLLAEAERLRVEDREPFQREADIHVGLAQVAATMYGHLRPSPAGEAEWEDAFADRDPVLQGEVEAELDDPEAGG